MKKKYIISGGGTGGHIYPAIAIAQALQKQNPDAQILFVGAEGKMEMEKVPKAGYKIIGLPIRGIQRQLSLANLSVPFRLIKSLWKANQIIKDFQPDAVIGVGGYASAAMMKVAVWHKIPILIQEQNSYAGLTNKWLAKDAQKICVAYPEMEKYFPEQKIVFTGNPVRADLNTANLEEAYRFFGLQPHKKTLLVLGGSLGARTINQCLKTGIQQILEAGFQVIWQTGKAYYADIEAFTKNIDTEGLFVRDFIYEMNFAYSIADVVISRAGALSISELCLAAKATILVPSPNVSEDHQSKNAMALVKKEAAVLVKDQEASQKLIETALELLKDEQKQQKLAKNIQTLAVADASLRIVAEVVGLNG